MQVMLLVRLHGNIAQFSLYYSATVMTSNDISNRVACFAGSTQTSTWK